MKRARGGKKVIGHWEEGEGLAENALKPIIYHYLFSIIFFQVRRRVERSKTDERVLFEEISYISGGIEGRRERGRWPS